MGGYSGALHRQGFRIVNSVVPWRLHGGTYIMRAAVSCLNNTANLIYLKIYIYLITLG